MYEIFKYHVYDYRLLFESSDLGEVFAIAIALTLGCMCLVTDDIKERGPHYTLMRTITDSEIMPLAFYEILFIDYLQAKITVDELYKHFYKISNMSELHWSSPYNENDKMWMKVFCKTNNINPKSMLNTLNNYLKEIHDY